MIGAGNGGFIAETSDGPNLDTDDSYRAFITGFMPSPFRSPRSMTCW